jgi:hypothetical protein
MHPEDCWSRGRKDHSGAAATVARRSRRLACVTLMTVSTVMACSASGTALPGAQTKSEPSSSVAPTSTAQATQDQVVKKICQQEEVDVSVNKCGDFYSTYPTGFVVDAATEIFDKNGEHIDSCGGNRFFSSDQAREEAERRCAAYLARCTRVVDSCRSLP